MSDKQTRCVAHFDVLGFSKIVKDNSEKAWDILKTLHKLLSIIPQKIPCGHTGREIVSRLETVFFSDTIIIYTEQDDFEDICSIF